VVPVGIDDGDQARALPLERARFSERIAALDEASVRVVSPRPRASPRIAGEQRSIGAVVLHLDGSAIWRDTPNEIAALVVFGFRPLSERVDFGEHLAVLAVLGFRDVAERVRGLDDEAVSVLVDRLVTERVLDDGDLLLVVLR